jgi:VanZ family protein
MILKTTNLKTKLIAWFCVVAWMGLIFAFSNQAHSGEITGHYLGSFNVLVRKCGHMSEYAMLFFLLRRALLCTVDGGIYFFVAPFVLCVLYAISDEFHQSFVAGRSSSASDVLIDSLGALIGFGLVKLWLRLHKPPA